MPLKKYQVAVLDPNNERRNRLKVALGAVGDYGDLSQYNSKDNLIAALPTFETLDITFVSFDYSIGDFKELVRVNRESGGDSDTCFVLMLQQSQKSKEVVAAFSAAGADGFLLEPFSVDEAREISSVAAGLRRERRLLREIASYKSVARKLVEQVDTLATLKQLKAPLGVALRSLRETCRMFDALDGESLERAQRIIFEAFENTQPPPDVVKEIGYAGPSKFVRKRLAERLLAQASSAPIGGGES
jgi:DNA-binding NarL/FixJ family response regulator